MYLILNGQLSGKPTLPGIVPRFFNEQKWSIGREAVWTIWNFLALVYTTSFYWRIVPVCTASSTDWVEQLFRAFLIGLIPGIACIYFNYSRALKNRLNKAEDLNQKLLNKISLYEHGELNLIGENKMELIRISTDKLILIQSHDNYAKLILDSEYSDTSSLIRSSLRNLEKQIDYPFIVRCHRSFIINLAKVEELTGNARDFKVRLKNHPFWVPVSRDAYKKIAGYFETFSSKPNSAISFSFDKNNIQ